MNNITFGQFVLYLIILIGISILASLVVGITGAFFGGDNIIVLLMGFVMMFFPLHYTFNYIYKDCVNAYKQI